MSFNDVVSTVKNLESGLNSLNLDNDTITEIREGIVDNITRHSKKSIHISESDREFAKNLVHTKTFLKNNNDIFFTKADKGNLTVCMNISDYKQKMNTLLEDKSTYLVINKNPLKPLQKKSTQNIIIIQ